MLKCAPIMTKANYSRQVLEDTPSRVLQFLSGVGTSPLIRGALGSFGYTAKDHEEGWTLLHHASGYQIEAPEPTDRPATEAIAELDAWDEPNFRLARAALLRRYPDQEEFVFEGLEAAAGPAAVLSVKTFLDRLDALQGTAAGRDHKVKSTKQADAAALKTLAARGITESERTRLRKLIAAAERGEPPMQATAGDKQDAEARQEALASLRAWFDEWSETARVVIKRRDQLIRLGLAQRRSGTGKEDPEPTPAATPVPA